MHITTYTKTVYTILDYYNLFNLENTIFNLHYCTTEKLSGFLFHIGDNEYIFARCHSHYMNLIEKIYVQCTISIKRLTIETLPITTRDTSIRSTQFIKNGHVVTTLIITGIYIINETELAELLLLNI